VVENVVKKKPVKQREGTTPAISNASTTVEVDIAAKPEELLLLLQTPTHLFLRVVGVQYCKE
jgi:hypothetical protein